MNSRDTATARSIVTGVLVLVLLMIGALVLAWGLWQAFRAVAPHVNTTFVTALSTAIGSAVTLVLTKKWDRMWEIEQQHRTAKIPVYEQFMHFLFRVFLGSKGGGPKVTEEEMMTFIVGFTQKLIVWGSDDVLREYGRFRQTMTGDNQGIGIMYNLERLLYAIRSDIGHKNKGLEQGGLLKLFINDLPKDSATNE